MKINRQKLRTIILEGEDDYKNATPEEFIRLLKKQVQKIRRGQELRHQRQEIGTTFGEYWGTDNLIQLLDCIE